MSYNIDTWKVKMLEGLTIPLSALSELDDPSFDVATKTLSYESDLSEGFELMGVEDGDVLRVSKIEHWGEGSGYRWGTLKEILAQSTGELIVALVWEGGDSLSRLIVKNGAVTEEDIEL